MLGLELAETGADLVFEVNGTTLFSLDHDVTPVHVRVGCHNSTLPLVADFLFGSGVLILLLGLADFELALFAFELGAT